MFHSVLINYCVPFFFGTLWGSFFYTLSLRAGNEDFSLKSLVTPSQCPGCGKNINPVLLFPIFGYLFLRGRCSACAGHISFLYPITEAGYGIIAILVFQHYGITFEALIYFLITGLAISISIIDVRTFRIPGSLTAVLAILALYPALSELVNGSVWNALGGAPALGCFFTVVLLLFPGGFGGGDIKFGAAIGLVVGFEQSIVVLETALVCGALFGIIYGAVTRRGLRIKIPFAPFLTLGLCVSMFFGREIIMIYNRVVY